MARSHIALVGLGTMGAAVGQRLLAAGYPLTVHNRTPDKAEPLVAAGASWAASPAQAVVGAQVVLLSLSDGAAVDGVLFGPRGVVGHAPAGLRVVDTSTVSPSHARSVAERLAAAGIGRVEACVVGNAELARRGELRVLAAGVDTDVEAVHDVLATLGEVRKVGGTGQAAALKLVFNALLGGQLAALADAVAYGVAAGLDRRTVLGAVAASGFASKVLAFRCDLALRGQLDPAAFRTALMDKDLRLVLAEAAGLGTDLPTVAAAEQRFAAAVSAGQGDLDAAAVLADPRQQPGSSR